MPEARRCPSCGAKIAPGAPGGLCTACTLKAGLGIPTEATKPVEPDLTPILARAASPLGVKFHYFGDYELLEEIARGGMGVVFKARQISLNRVVALKFIHPGRIESGEAIRRFRLEAEATARLDHPNIVPIYEIGEHEGHHYFSMKFVEGGSLATKCDVGGAKAEPNSPLDSRTSALLLGKVARAVHYAHQRGILHRDLKPGNILLDAGGEPHLTDFGLAKLTEQDDGLTLTGQLFGTPSYMSPEQAAGRHKNLTTASDLWSLGAILYELLAGQRPFCGDTPVETLRKVMEEDPVPPSKCEARNARDDRSGRLARRSSHLSRDLETICLKCLEKDPAHRYASAAALADDLDHWLRDEPILARRATPFERITKWARRQPVLAASVVALHLAFALGVVGVLWQWGRAERHASEEGHQRQRAEAELKRAERAEQQMRESLRDAYLAQARAHRFSGRAGRRFDSLDALKKAADIRPGMDLRNEAIAAMSLPDLRMVKVGEALPVVNSRFAADHSLRRYAFANFQQGITILDVAGNETVASLQPQGLPTRFMRFSADRRYLAAYYAGDHFWPSKVCVWDIERQKVILTIPDHRVERRLDFNPRRPELAIAVDDGSISLYDVTQQKLLHRLTGGLCPLAISYAPDGERMVVTIAHQPLVQVRDIRSGELVATLPHRGEVMETAWDEGTRLLATACLDGQVYLWDVDTWDAIGTLRGHQDGVFSVGFANDGNFLMSCGADNTLNLWDLSSRSPVVSAANPNRSVVCTPHALGRNIGMTRLDGAIHLIEFEKASEGPTFGRGISLIDARFHPDGDIAAAAHADGAFLFDAGAVELGFIPFHGCRTVMFTTDGNSLLIGGESGLQRWPIKRFDSGTGASLTFGPPKRIELSVGQPDKGLVSDLRPIGGSERVAVCLYDQAIIVLDPSLPADARVLKRDRRVNVVAASPDGQWLAAGSEPGSGVAVWDVQASEPPVLLPVANSATVGFSPNSQWLVTGTRTDYCFWKTGSWELGRVVSSENPHEQPGMSFSPDGRLFAMAKTPATMELMDANTREVLATMPTGILGPRCFSTDSTKLLAGTEQGGVRVWDLRLIRDRLVAMNLDWNQPSYPPGREVPPQSLHVEVLLK